VDEMRRSGIYVQEFSPGKGQDKIARVNAISDMFTSGQVWFPETWWASEVVDELLAFPAGEHDDAVDACLTECTLVTMADGSRKAIKSVRVGDYVATPYGPRRVLESGCTGMAVVYPVAGGRLFATANHPIATTNGWIRVDCIRNESIIDESNYRSSSWLFQQNPEQLSTKLSLTGTHTADTLTPNPQPIADITRARVDTAYIERFGSLCMGLYQKVGTSITKTKTFLTTALRTLSASRQASTPQSILKIGPNEDAPSNSLPTLQQLETKQKNGTGLKKGESGTGSTPSEAWQKLGAPQRLLKSTATNARLVGASLLRTPNLLDFALVYAGTYTTTTSNESKRKSSGAHCSVNSVQSPTLYSELTKFFAACSAKQSSTTRRSVPVYNLTVEGAECYFANGVLVHNCSLALHRIRKGGLLRLASDNVDDDDYVAPRRGYY
jgi:hypothetical protein